MTAADIETTLVGRPDLERPSSPRAGVARRRAGSTALHVGLVVAGIAMVFPFAWMLITSFKTLPQLLQDPRSFWPAPWTIDNYVEAWNAVPSPRCPAVQHHGIVHQSRRPHEWSRSPKPSTWTRSSPMSTSPCTMHACS